MQITTKFELGQQVWPITTRTRAEKADCPKCDGTGHAELSKGGTVRCPEPSCYYGKVTTTRTTRWCVDTEHASAVGSIKITRSARPLESETRYMIEATGVGSGQLWAEAELFANEAEAEAECDRRNGASSIEPAVAVEVS